MKTTTLAISAALITSAAYATNLTVSTQNLDFNDGTGNDLILLSPTSGAEVPLGTGQISVGFFGAAAADPEATLTDIVNAFVPYVGASDPASVAISHPSGADGFFAFTQGAYDVSLPEFTAFLNQDLGVLIVDAEGNVGAFEFTDLQFEDTAAQDAELSGTFATDASITVFAGSQTGPYAVTSGPANGVTFESFTLAPIPEPSSALLLGGSLLALGFRRRRA